MSAGKGDSPRPVKGDAFRSGWENIWGKPTHETHHAGEVVDGMECLGDGRWHVVDQKEPELRDET